MRGKRGFGSTAASQLKTPFARRALGLGGNQPSWPKREGESGDKSHVGIAGVTLHSHVHW